MEDEKKVVVYFRRIQTLANQMKTCSEKIDDQLVVEKVTENFDPEIW